MITKEIHIKELSKDDFLINLGIVMRSDEYANGWMIKIRQPGREPLLTIFYPRSTTVHIATKN
jgi:hypothetical protein